MHSEVPPAPHIAILPVLPSSGCSLGRCRLRFRDLLLLRWREGKYARAKGGRKANEEMMSRKALFWGERGRERTNGRWVHGDTAFPVHRECPPARKSVARFPLLALRGRDRAPPFPHFHGWQFPLGAIISRRRKEGHVPRLLPVLPSRGTHFSQYAQLDKNAFSPSFSVNIRPRKCTLWLLQKWEIAPIRPGLFRNRCTRWLSLD